MELLIGLQQPTAISNSNGFQQTVLQFIQKANNNMQKAISVVKNETCFSNVDINLKELNEMLADGWKIVSMTPVPVAPIESGVGNNSYSAILVYVFPMIILLEKNV
jgi:hypothetical protein